MILLKEYVSLTMVAMEMEKRYYLSYHSKSCKGEKYGSYKITITYKQLIKLKVTFATKHKNTAKEIIIYTHRVYSLLLKLTFTLYISPWHADFASDLFSVHTSLRGYTNMMAVA